MSDSDKDSIEVRDRSTRRQFIRRGAAFVAAGSVVGATQNVYADDCDRGVTEGKNAQAPGSDSDSGEGADPQGCGKQPKPKMSNNTPDIKNTTEVVKVKA